MAPSTDAQGRLLCGRTDVQLTATVRSSSYPSGSQPVLGLTVKNVGSKICTQDVSGSKQVFSVVTATGGRIWATSDCFPGTGTQIATLQPGESLQFNIRWAGTISRPGCAGERSTVGAGHYVVQARLGSWNATPVELTLS